MSFKFFPDQDPSPTTKEPQKLADCKQVVITQTHYEIVNKLRKQDNAISELRNLTDLKFKCVNVSELGSNGVVTGAEVVEILNSSSDLKSGVYEGGFKTWECTYDLVAYLQDNVENLIPLNRTSPLKVLDLGCGSGLLGLSVLELAKRRNVDVRVDFQDYNQEVLDNVTIPNTLLNYNDEIVSTCRYFSGDWSSFVELLDKQTYDVILSSETIYNLEYFGKIIRVLEGMLDGDGCLYLAAKTFYFGVGGGTNAFMSMVNGHGGLEAETVRVFKEGVKREIIRVRRKK